MPKRVIALIAATLAACGGSDDSSGPTPSQTFAGTYATRVTLTQSSCGAVTVQDNPTVVSYDATSNAASFTHAGQTYRGTVRADSSFTTTPASVNVNDGFQYSIALSGRFRANAFEADATVDRTGGAGACRFTVHWVGTR
jgi:hypothetical protein